MKKLLHIFTLFTFSIILWGCKKNTQDVVIAKEVQINVSNQVLKNWLQINGGNFKEGKITIINTTVGSKGINDNKTGNLDWEHAVTYTFKGVSYTKIPFSLSVNQNDTGSVITKFSLVFRFKKDTIEARFKTFTKVADVSDSSTIYAQESYYSLNGELLEAWIYKNKKAYKINKKYLTVANNSNKPIGSRTCKNIPYYTYGPLIAMSDGSFRVMRYTNYTTQCTEDAYVEPEEYDYGGGSYENWDPTPIITDCQGTPDGTATWSNDCNTCIGGTTGITSCPIDTIKNPCIQVDSLATNSLYKAMLDDLKSKTSDIHESGYVYKRNADGSFVPTFIVGKDNAAGIDFEFKEKVDGFIHNHYTGLLSVFSPDDIYAMAVAYTSDKMVNPLTFSIGVVTANGTQYLLMIDDFTKFQQYANNIVTNSTLILYSFIFGSVYGISPTNSNDDNEKLFLQYLQTTNSGLKFFKGNNDFTQWQPKKADDNGNVVNNPCQ
ncbi:MAG: hypothetical protein WKF85_11960 [Chitinophagaceae bacterium]